jgi:hypothetical protein
MYELLECGFCGTDVRSITTDVGTKEEVEVSRFWASIYSFKRSRRIEARSVLHPELRNWDSAKLLQFAEFLGELDESAPDRRLESGTQVLIRPEAIHHLSASQRRAVNCAIFGLRSPETGYNLEN